MRIKTALSAVLLIILALCGCSSDYNNVVIAFKFQPDLSLNYKGTVKSSVSVFENDEQTEKLNLDSEINSNLKVIKINDNGSAQCEMTLSNDSGDQTQFDFVMNRLGEISNLEIRQAVDSQLNLKNLNFPTFSDQPVSIGDRWDFNTKTLLGSDSVDIVTEYKYVGTIDKFGHDCLHLTYKGKTEIPIKKMYESGIYRKGSDLLTISGVICFDPANGYIVYQSEKYQIERSLKESRDTNLISKYRLNYKLETEYQLTDSD